MNLLLPLLREFALTCLATLGFGLLFNVPRRALIACCLTGAIGREARLLALRAGADPVGASFVGGLAVASLGYLLARFYHMPRAIFTVTGIIPMVPGVSAFTSMLELASGHTTAGIAASVETILTGGALAMGLTTVRVLTRIPEPREIRLTPPGGDARLPGDKADHSEDC
jgi:uncharacterized membrane protein YjjB (DUF3815 family)